MSDDEDFMADRRGTKRAHESPKKISSLFEGEALDAGDECSVESDFRDEWNEHFKNHPSQQEPEDSEDEATESDDNDKCQSIETAIKDPNYWHMKDQDFKELAESFHAIYMDPDLRRELLQLEDGLDAEPDSAEDDEPEMRSDAGRMFIDRNPNTQKDVVLIEGVLPPLRTHVKHCTTIETIVHPRIVATLI